MTSIFRKQFFLYTGSLVICFTLLGIGLVQGFTSYFYNQKRNDMVIQAEKIATLYLNYISDESNVSTEEFETELEILEKYLSSSYMLADNNGIVIFTSQDINKNVLNKQLEIDNLPDVLCGSQEEYKGTLSNIFDSPVYTIGYPIMEERNQCVAALFLSAPMIQLESTLFDAYRIIIIFICVAILIGFVLVFISSRAITQPLMELNDAAKVIASGDFEKRIRLTSNDEIGQLADSFNEMAGSLFQQEKRRREFISNISHDLRSPLTSMRGFLQALIDGTIPYEKQDHYLHIVLDETERLAKMANTILDINKLEENENTLVLKKFDINTLVRETAFKFEERVMQNNIKLKTLSEQEVIMVNADYDKIQRVIYNLLDNAVKFTHKYGNITVLTEIKEKKVYVHIKDNGKGVSKEEQKRVFDRLYKADFSRGKDKKGSGLGLSIVKAFIKAHNETITLKSDIGKGCEFIFTLTLAEDIKE